MPEPSLAEILDLANRRALLGVCTSIPATVESYDPVTQTADCKPSVKRRIALPDGGAEYQDLPVIPKVPVGFPRAGGFVLSLPLEKGDRVWLVFSQYPTGEWQATGTDAAEPKDGRLHGMSSPMAIPAGYTLKDPLAPADLAARTAGIVLGKDGAAEQIRISDAGKIQLGGAAATIPLTLATPLLAHIAAQSAALAAIQTALTGLQGYGDALNLLLAGAAAPAAGASLTAVTAAGVAIGTANTVPAVSATLVKGV